MENNKELEHLIDTIRNVLIKDGIEEISLLKLNENPLVQKDLLEKYFNSDEEIAKAIFENERNHFEEVFEDNNFETSNAIDNLFTVSEVIAKNFHYLSPTLYHYYQEHYPAIYETYFNQRTDAVFDKIQINLNRGIWQGFYRDDLGIELVARGYISRLIDLYNKDNFPAEEFSFDDFFNQMVETFVLSIVTEKGLDYWNKKKKIVKL